MKKVLIVTGSLPPIPCGVGYYAQRLSEELARNHVDFSLLSTDGVDLHVPAPLMTVPSWKISSLPKILRAIRSSGAEIVHIQYPAVGYRRQLGINLLPYALRLLQRKLTVVITLHEYHQSRLAGRLRNLITIIPAHKIIVSNSQDALALSRFKRRLEVIPIGSNIEPAKKDPDAYKKIMSAQKLDPGKPTLLFFGYAFPDKGLDVLLDALSKPALASFQLLLITSLDKNNPYHRGLSQKIASINNPRSRVGVTGFLESNEVSAVMQECRYFVLPATQPLSAKSGTAIAAVQHGLIVVSRGAANPADTEPFKHELNSCLLDDVTPDAIAGAIETMESSPKLAASIKAGTKELGAYFAWPHIVKEHLKVYSEL